MQGPNPKYPIESTTEEQELRKLALEHLLTFPLQQRANRFDTPHQPTTS